MNLSETFSAMRLGYNSVPKKCDLLILGEMGISNTTSAAVTISCALFSASVKKWTGLGTGISSKRLKNKISVIKGLKLHGKKFDSVIEILSCFGGREMK